jgi:hypothetical protein
MFRHWKSMSKLWRITIQVWRYQDGTGSAGRMKVEKVIGCGLIGVVTDITGLLMVCGHVVVLLLM